MVWIEKLIEKFWQNTKIWSLSVKKFSRLTVQTDPALFGVSFQDIGIAKLQKLNVNLKI